MGLKTKKDKLQTVDVALIIVAIFVLISSIQMEATAGAAIFGVSFTAYTIVHIVLAISMMGLVSYHLYLHFGWKQWVAKLRKTPKVVTRILSVVAALALISGVAATTEWLIHRQHTPIGGIHGKIGFLMLAIVVGHTIRRAKWLK